MSLTTSCSALVSGDDMYLIPLHAGGVLVCISVALDCFLRVLVQNRQKMNTL